MDQNSTRGTKKLPTPAKGGFPRLEVSDLEAVVYSSGKVFEGLSTGRLDTDSFLRSGDTKNISSKRDLYLLEDLRDVSQFIIDRRGAQIDAGFACEVNRLISRSGSMHPGQLREPDDRPPGERLGVSTGYGRHEPDALDQAGLQKIVDASLRHDDVREQAISLFVNVARAQPFWDGNKRTALFLANSALLSARSEELLTIPFDENEPHVARRFNDSLSRAYVLGDDAPITELFRERGFAPMRSGGDS